MEIDLNQMEVLQARDTGYVVRANLFLSGEELAKLFHKEEVKE